MNGERDSYEQECAEQGYNIMLHVIDPKSGALLADHSSVPGDREVLFPSNISFQPVANPENGRILNEDKDGVVHIYVREVKKP